MADSEGLEPLCAGPLRRTVQTKSPIKVGNWWKYTTSGSASYTTTDPAMSTVFSGGYSYTILCVDTPGFSVRLEAFFIEKVEWYYFPNIVTIDTIRIDTVFAFVDGSNHVKGVWRYKHARFPLYKMHYVKRNPDGIHGSSRATIDPPTRQIRYVWSGVGAVVTEINTADIGLMKWNARLSGRYSGGSSETVLVDKGINRSDRAHQEGERHPAFRFLAH